MNKINMNIKYIVLLLLCFAMLSFGYYFFFHKKVKPVSVSYEPTKINVIRIRLQDVPIINKYVGYVEAIQKVQIVPYISGYLQNISVAPGQFVQKDDLLVTIEPSEYKAKLDIAEANVLKAVAAFDYSNNYFERVQKSGKKAFSEIDIDNAKNSYLQAQAMLKNAEANRDLAAINYKYTTIKAPISGLIGNFDLSPGDYVAPDGGSLLNIVQTDPIRVVFSVTDSEFLEMKKNNIPFKDSVINIILADGSHYPYAGTFKYTDNQFNKATDSLAIYTYFQNSENKLLPNAYVTVEISHIFKDSVLIDKNLIQMQKNGYFLTIERQNKLTQIPVHILAEKDNQYVLENTFEPDDLLVLEDVSNLENTQNVKFNVIQY